MNKKPILISILALVLLLIFGWFFSANLSLRSKFEQSKQLTLKMQEHIKQVESEKAKIAEESDKLKEDALFYLDTNNKLQAEKDAAEKKFEAAKALLKRKEKEIAQDKAKLSGLAEKIAGQQAGVDSKLAKEKQELEKSIAAIEQTLKGERAIYHYNLAVAYTQAKLYDEAIIEYTKALNFNPGNAEAYYNLGLIYSKAIFNPEKSTFYYTNYLKLKPDAYDADEVRALIDDLE